MMVRQDVGLRQAAHELGFELSVAEEEAIRRRKSFQRLLWLERFRYYDEVAKSPERNRSSMVGQLMLCAQKLMLEGAFDKAAEVLYKAARLEGWIGGEGNVNVFADLTAKDIQSIREKLKSDKLEPAVN